MRVHIAPLRPTTALDRKSQPCNDSAQPTCSHASGDPRLHRLCLLVLFTQASGGTHGMDVQGDYSPSRLSADFSALASDLKGPRWRASQLS